jgi:D-3-phosphoglycerate dehydrogenase / 2-oxoglutarate reductase
MRFMAEPHVNPSHRWNVARFDLWINPVFDEIVGSDASLSLAVAPVRDADKAWPVLEAAHVYQITAAKDELPAQFRANEQLLRRCPDLLCVSSARSAAIPQPSPK